MLKKTILVSFTFLSVSSIADMTSTEEQNKKLTKEFYAEVDNKNYDVIDRLFIDNYVEHEVVPGVPPTKEGMKLFFANTGKVFPDRKHNIKFMMADGDKVAVYLNVTGTHKGEIIGKPGSGKTFSISAVDILHFKDGKLVEHWGSGDYLTMYTQLDFIKMK
ncbi:ester cyclase [Spartinivicinus ruber]|uniref:ester cyclase n=1 Tax=Spartinivicinus ruber TaxID=2683272 RepID=UPI0013D382F7|nr:ester cyclase [Spartinivicinus ruber]